MTHQRQFRAHTENDIASIKRLRPACSLSLGDSGQRLPGCCAALFPGPVEATK